MANGTSTDPIQSATGILGQLLKYTQQLAAFERNPDVDVAALSKACAERLKDLKQVLPRAMQDLAHTQQAGASSGETPLIVERIRQVQEQSRTCAEVLQRGRDRAARQHKDLLNARRAIRAYST